MTPALQSGVANPLSAITTESLVDLGYTVDSSGADSFTGAFSAPARLADSFTGTFSAPARMTASAGRIIDLENDTYRGPVQVVDHSGYVTRTIPRR